MTHKGIHVSFPKYTTKGVPCRMWKATIHGKPYGAAISEEAFVRNPALLTKNAKESINAILKESYAVW